MKIAQTIGFLMVFGLWMAATVNAAVTIATFEDKTIVQRASGKGSFAASGTFTGTPTGIQVRVIKAEGGMEARTWKSATKISAGKKWNVVLDNVPEGGWYKVEVREQGKTATVKSANRFGVGMILLMIGQSNMEGFCFGWGPADETIQPHPLTSFLKYHSYKWYTPEVRPDSGLPVVLLANNLAKAMKIPVGMITVPAGASSINEWLGDTTKAGRYLPGFINKAFKAAKGDIEATCWHQGYADFGTGPGATLTPEAVKNQVWNTGWDEYEQKVKNKQAKRIPYYEKLTRLYNVLDKKAKRNNMLFFCGIKGRSLAGIHVESKIDGIPQSPRVDCVRWAQMSWAKDHPNGRVLGHAMDMRMNDGAHEQPRDRFNMASRWAQSILQAVGKASHCGAGASFDSKQAGFADGGILLKVKHDGGTKLSVPYPAKAIEGFLVRQPGKKEAVKIKKITIRQPDWVHLELASQPTGDLLVSYLSGPVPFSDRKPAGGKPPEYYKDDAPGNILYDNASLPSGNFRSGNMVQASLGWIRISKQITPPAVCDKPVQPAPSGLRLTVSPSMRIGYSLQQASHVSLRLYDAHGRISLRLVDGLKIAGTHTTGCVTKSLPNGFYIANLKAGDRAVSRKLAIRQ